MWTENDKGIHLVIRLIGLTNSKKIRWKRASPEAHALVCGRGYVNYMYIAEAGDDMFRLAERDKKGPYDDESYGRGSNIDLDIIDKDGRALWHCPPNPAIENLFEIVVGSATDLDGLIARLDSLAQAS